MISAKLIKDLEKKGFSLEFPSYESNEERIIDILNQRNQRLNIAIPLLLMEEFDYEKIIKKINIPLKKEFDKIIIISNKIFEMEEIDYSYLKETIQQNKLNIKIKKEELAYYHGSFKMFLKNRETSQESFLKDQIKSRAKLSINKSLAVIFSPAKIRIMEKIFKHEPLTNTELKYYYRSIRPINSAILNEDLQDYLKITESAKKISEKKQQQP